MIKLKLDRENLIPAVIQDYRTGEVLMVAYMNRKSFARTLKTKKTCFFSRSRQKLWTKGETSGNIQELREMYVDCDADCILCKVVPKGAGAACHLGYYSCFYRKLDEGRKTFEIIAKRRFDPDAVYKKQ